MMRGLLLVVGLLCAGTAQAQDADANGAQPARTPAKVYASTCGYCHGRNVGPIILGRALPADYVKGMVRGGRNAMPAFRPSEISPGELAALAHWVEQSPANPKENGK